MASARKSTTKSAAKNKAPKKVASKKSSAKRPAPKKAATKKAAPKKQTTKAAPKKQTKKAATKKAAPKQAAPKKQTSKAAPKKAAAKKQTKRRTTTAAARASVAKSPFSKKFLDVQRAALLSEREVYLRQATNLKAEADALVLDMDPGDVQFDEESGEGDTVQVERERDLVLSAQALQAVGEIDHALAKFDLGTYGICEVSGDPIPEERLDAIPWARERVEYKVGGLNRR
ncbi:MAG TPA: TraR/DksA C4-type zinc finger protein [Acidimicrobiales bacterium]|nr:TraR/DksA C4-type zinc finger protein [Acidimicrobiales bacterium]